MRSWRKFRDLPPADRRLLLQAAVLLVCARLGMRFIDFRVDARADSGTGATATHAPDLARAVAIARLVGIASGHAPVAVACLHRSLVLWWLLRRNGIPCELRLGARTGAGPFGAHAWVQCAGVALNEDAAHLAQYAPFAQAVVPVHLRNFRTLPPSCMSGAEPSSPRRRGPRVVDPAGTRGVQETLGSRLRGNDSQ